jgi:hypothetical protein
MTDWASATVGCNRTLYGTRVGAGATRTVEGLDPGIQCGLQLVSFDLEGGVWRNALYSNGAAGITGGG